MWGLGVPVPPQSIEWAAPNNAHQHTAANCSGRGFRSAARDTRGVGHPRVGHGGNGSIPRVVDLCGGSTGPIPAGHRSAVM